MFRFKYSILLILILSTHFTYFAMEQSNNSMPPDIIEAMRDQQQLVDQEDAEIEDDQYSKDQKKAIEKAMQKIYHAEVDIKLAERGLEYWKLRLSNARKGIQPASDSDTSSEDEFGDEEIKSDVADTNQASKGINRLGQLPKKNKYRNRKFGLSESQKLRNKAKRGATKINTCDWSYGLIGLGVGLIALVAFCQYKFYHMNENNSED